MTKYKKKNLLKYKVTYLEMNKRPNFTYPISPVDNTELKILNEVSVNYFLSLYKNVGEQYEWTDMFKQKKSKIKTFLENSDVFFFELYVLKKTSGFFILDFRKKKICDISYIGLTPSNIGKGLGKYLLQSAILTSWDMNEIIRLTINTCTLDHQTALPLYLKFGFQPFKYENKERIKTFFN